MTLRKKILIFLSMAVAIHSALVAGFYYFVNNNSKLLITQKNFDALPDEKKPRYLFMGDSHCARSVNDSLIEGSFNLGYYGENPVRTYYRLKVLLENENKKPEIIFLQAELSRFAYYFCRFNINQFFYKNYVDEWELMQNDNYDYSYVLNSFKYTLFPYVEWRELMLKNTNVKEEKSQVEFLATSEKERKRSTRKFVTGDLLQGDPNSLFDPLGLYYLEKSIELCKEKNVKLIFIKYPSTDYFINEFILFCGKNTVAFPLQDEIIRKHGLEIWNYEQTFASRYELFFDSHHMNAKGKKEFSELLNARIQSLAHE